MGLVGFKLFVRSTSFSQHNTFEEDNDADDEDDSAEDVDDDDENDNVFEYDRRYCCCCCCCEEINTAGRIFRGRCCSFSSRHRDCRDAMDRRGLIRLIGMPSIIVVYPYDMIDSLFVCLCCCAVESRRCTRTLCYLEKIRARDRLWRYEQSTP